MNSQNQKIVLSHAIIYGLAIVFMVFAFLNHNLPIFGFRWLPDFGAEFEHKMSKEFMSRTGYLIGSQSGYDGQFYAQLAIDPLLLNQETPNAMDNFEFRARRPLFLMTAYVAGAGNPRAVLQAYSVQNIVFWLILAGVLLYWLPPASWQNTFRYVAILYSVGLVGSIQKALLDGPALTLIAIGVLLAERRRPWLSAITLGLAGLGKETSIFAASLFGFPKLTQPKEVLLLALKLILVILPLGVWVFYLSTIEHSARTSSFGNRSNFGWPLMGWWTAVQALHANIRAGQPIVYLLSTTIFLISLPVQVLGLLTLRRTSNLWWRVGAVFAGFSFFIGYATWEGVVGSAARLCMPVTIAINLLAPHTSRWLVVLIIGNMLSLLGLHAMIVHPPPQQFLTMPLRHGISTGYNVEWKNGWYLLETDKQIYWRWSSGRATLDIWPVRPLLSQAVMRFKVRAVKPMDITISTRDGPLLSVTVGDYLSEEIEVVVPLSPGANPLYFQSNSSGMDVAGDERQLSFRLINPTIRIK